MAAFANANRSHCRGPHLCGQADAKEVGQIPFTTTAFVEADRCRLVQALDNPARPGMCWSRSPGSPLGPFSEARQFRPAHRQGGEQWPTKPTKTVNSGTAKKQVVKPDTKQNIVLASASKWRICGRDHRGHDWQPHSVRGFFSGALEKRLKTDVLSAKDAKTDECRDHVAALKAADLHRSGALHVCRKVCLGSFGPPVPLRRASGQNFPNLRYACWGSVPERMALRTRLSVAIAD